MAVPLRVPAPQPAVFAHRGAHGPDRPENSLSAIERALELDAPGVEIDVCSLRDGTLVAAHDNWTVCGGRRVSLAELMFSDLCRISKGTVLEIDTALDLFCDTDALLCLDWKGTGDVTTIGRVVQRHGIAGRTIVSSSEPAAVAGLKHEYPRLAAGLSFDGRAQHSRETAAVADEIVGALATSGADAAMLHHRLGDRDLIGAMRALGVAVFLWTARDTETFELLWNRSPDGIMSDLVEEHHPGDRRQGRSGLPKPNRGHEGEASLAPTDPSQCRPVIQSAAAATASLSRSFKV
jgi:glycerophosphoryl diester phosphodiesterase